MGGCAQAVMKGRDGLTEEGHDKFRRDLGEGAENEGALVHAGMGHGEAWFVDHGIAVEQEVEIEGSGATDWHGCPVSSVGVLDLEEGVEQRARSQGCFEYRRGVEEAGLWKRPHGLGVNKCGDSNHACCGKGLDGGDSGEEDRAAVAEVGAKRDSCTNRHAKE
jgi:hypothetical protein